MIVPMKKIHVIVDQPRAQATVEQLRALGKIHIEHQNECKSPMIQELGSEIGILGRVLDVLKQQKTKADQKESADLKERTNIILERVGLLDDLRDSIASRKKMIKAWELWGDFNPDDIRALEEKGLIVQLFIRKKKERDIKVENTAIVVFRQGKGVDYCMSISQEKVTLPFQTVALPIHSLSRMKSLLSDEELKLQEIEVKLKENTRYIEDVTDSMIEKQDDLWTEEVKVGMENTDNFVVLKGYVPDEDMEGVKELSKKEGWALLIEELDDDDQAPVLIRNPKWMELINPVFNMISILPGYKEIDISSVFLIFFSLFFGILIGDAGYGVVFAGLTAFAHIKKGKTVENKTPFYLMYLLSFCTIVWGVLTGTYFGQAWLPDSVGPVVPWLVEERNVQRLCFIIAAVHLSIAHFWLVLRSFPSLKMLKDCGWIVIIWAMYLLTNHFVLGTPWPSVFLPMIIAGAALIILFPKPKVDPLLPLDIINCFTDVVSYIRLFAVGLATVAVADAANDMSIFWVIFLHTLNIALAAMAILVHGLRLNVLEFSGHLSMEWSGAKYNPFRRLKQT